MVILLKLFRSMKRKEQRIFGIDKRSNIKEVSEALNSNDNELNNILKRMSKDELCRYSLEMTEIARELRDACNDAVNLFLEDELKRTAMILIFEITMYFAGFISAMFIFGR